MKKTFSFVVSFLVMGLVIYSLGNYFFIAPLENELALVQAETTEIRIEAEKTRIETENEMKPLVARCELQNQLDPIFANLTWPVVGAETLSNYKVDEKSLEISLPRQSEIVSVAKGTIISVTDLTLYSNSTSKLVLIDHDNHLFSVYVGPNEIVVKEGQSVLAGELIGYSSKKETGSLHFELRHCYREINSVNFFQN